MKPPKGPFWAWTDIGAGLKWHLCVIAPGDESPMIKYLTEDFDDYWREDEWDEDDIVAIEAPAPQDA